MTLSPRAARRLARLTRAEDVLHSVCDLFQDRVAVATSLGPQTLVILDLLHGLGRTVPVFFLDTGLLFPETYALRRQVEDRYGIAIRAVRPRHSLAQQAEDEGPALWARDADRCCALRKVEPQVEALADHDAWITGLRRDQGPSRAGVETVDWDARYGLVKVAPLAHWSRADTWRYLISQGVPYNPLLDAGYPSVGCVPCTRRVDGPVFDERAGRWAGQGKTECGLHLAPT